VVPEFTLTPGAPFGIYIHVPFCATRCGYCDFNTYTPGELGGATPDGWLAALRIELALAAARVGAAPVQTVFVGGGTPSMLGSGGLAAVLEAVRDNFTLAPDAEVTTEANPESTSREFFEALRETGYTRVSLGMQSVVPHVLAVLDRTHSPGRALAAAAEARGAGFDHVNLDLIYGTPGESDDDLRRSVDAAVHAGVDHVSAYALVVEDGTALARRVRKGEVAAPDDDVLAQRYELLDAHLSAAGFQWYEVSNWSLPGGECRHNLGYWQGGEWWGAGPGAHGFLGTTRWWNIKHPNAYAQALAGGQLPIADFEDLDAGARHTEDVMLRLRLRDGLALGLLDDDERSRVPGLIDDGLIASTDDRLVLTDHGRLLADGVVRTLLP
jgi:oxygen-independent coproporphyrinogen-3 oxidase